MASASRSITNVCNGIVHQASKRTFSSTATVLPILTAASSSSSTASSMPTSSNTNVPASNPPAIDVAPSSAEPWSLVDVWRPVGATLNGERSAWDVRKSSGASSVQRETDPFIIALRNVVGENHNAQEGKTSKTSALIEECLTSVGGGGGSNRSSLSGSSSLAPADLNSGITLNEQAMNNSTISNHDSMQLGMVGVVNNAKILAHVISGRPKDRGRIKRKSLSAIIYPTNNDTENLPTKKTLSQRKALPHKPTYKPTYKPTLRMFSTAAAAAGTSRGSPSSSAHHQGGYEQQGPPRFATNPIETTLSHNPNKPQHTTVVQDFRKEWARRMGRDPVSVAVRRMKKGKTRLEYDTMKTSLRQILFETVNGEMLTCNTGKSGNCVLPTTEIIAREYLVQRKLLRKREFSAVGDDHLMGGDEDNNIFYDSENPEESARKIKELFPNGGFVSGNFGRTKGSNDKFNQSTSLVNPLKLQIDPVAVSTYHAKRDVFPMRYLKSNSEEDLFMWRRKQRFLDEYFKCLIHVEEETEVSG
jgi:hypothetical protein